jgi:hypothetical protein
MRPRFALIGLMYLAVANSALAVGYGWQELPDGGIEFFFRVEPGLLESYPGAYSDLPPGLPEIRRIQVVVSKDKVPNEGTLPKPVVQTAKPTIEDPVHSPKQDLQNPSSEKLILPPPPWDDKPTAFAESPKAVPIGSQSDGVVNSTHNDRETKNASGTSGSVTTDNPQPPKIEGSDTVDGKNEKTTSHKVEVPQSRPWLPLTGALVALFASLGTNAYLAWIHQTLRANYRALVARMKGDALAA